MIDRHTAARTECALTWMGDREWGPGGETQQYAVFENMRGCTWYSWLRGSQWHLAWSGKAPSWEHTTADCSCLGKGWSCRTTSKSPGAADRGRRTSAVYCTTARLQSRHRRITVWDNPSLGTSTCVRKLKAKGVTCSWCSLLLDLCCGSCSCGFQG